MQKRTKIILGIIVGIIVIGGLVTYLFFPKIWGSILYPLEYEEYIVKYSDEYDIDPAFVAAVIFSESRFNPDAISRAGARGLMQVMPGTARGIANNLGISDFNISDLHDPETSVKFGAWYLKDLLNRYNQDKETALAGYNGGPGVANRYVVSRSTTVIPHETAGYLKTVMGAYVKYQELYPDQLYGENIAEKMKIEQEKQEKSWWQKIVESVKEMTQ